MFFYYKTRTTKITVVVIVPGRAHRKKQTLGRTKSISISLGSLVNGKHNGLFLGQCCKHQGCLH